MKKLKKKIFLAISLLSLNLTCSFAMENQSNPHNISTDSEDEEVKELNKLSRNTIQQNKEITTYWNKTYMPLISSFVKVVKPLNLHVLFDADNDLFDSDFFFKHIYEDNTLSNEKFTVKQIQEIYKKCLEINNLLQTDVQRLKNNLSYYQSKYTQLNTKYNKAKSSLDKDYNNALLKLKKCLKEILENINSKISKIQNGPFPQILNSMDILIKQLKAFDSPNKYESFKEIVENNINQNAKKIIIDIFKQTANDLDTKELETLHSIEEVVLQLYALDIDFTSYFYNDYEKKELINTIKQQSSEFVKENIKKIIQKLYNNAVEILIRIQDDKNKTIKEYEKNTKDITKTKYIKLLRDQKKFVKDFKRIINAIKRLLDSVDCKNNPEFLEYNNKLESLKNESQKIISSIEDLDVDFGNINPTKQITIHKIILDNMKNIPENITTKGTPLYDFTHNLIKIMQNYHVKQKYNDETDYIVKLHDFLNSLGLQKDQKNNLENFKKVLKNFKIEFFKSIRAAEDEYTKNFLNKMNLLDTFESKNYSYENLVDLLNKIKINLENILPQKKYKLLDFHYYYTKYDQNDEIFDMFYDFLTYVNTNEMYVLDKFINSNDKDDNEYKELDDISIEKLKTTAYMSLIHDMLQSIIKIFSDEADCNHNKTLTNNQKKSLMRKIDRTCNSFIKLCLLGLNKIKKYVKLEQFYKDKYNDKKELEKEYGGNERQYFTDYGIEHPTELLEQSENVKRILESIKKNVFESIMEKFNCKGRKLNDLLPIEYGYEKNPENSKEISIPNKTTDYALEKYKNLTNSLNEIMKDLDYLTKKFKAFYATNIQNNKNRLDEFLNTDFFTKMSKQILNIVANNINIEKIINIDCFPTNVKEDPESCILKLSALKLKDISDFYSKKENEQEQKDIINYIKIKICEIFDKCINTPEQTLKEIYEYMLWNLDENLNEENKFSEKEKYKLEIDKTRLRKNDYLEFLKCMQETYHVHEILLKTMEDIEKILDKYFKKKEIKGCTFNPNNFQDIKMKLKARLEVMQNQILKFKNLYYNFKNDETPENVKMINRLVGITSTDKI